MGVSPWSLLFVVCLSPICAFLCVLCGLCVETRRFLSVAGGEAGGKAGWGAFKRGTRNSERGMNGGPAVAKAMAGKSGLAGNACRRN